MAKLFSVPVEIIVKAESQAEAESVVLGFIALGIETCDHQDRIERAKLHETSDTIEIG